MSVVETFRLREPRRQVLVALAVAVAVLVGLLVLYFAYFRVTYRVLFTNLRPMDAASIVAELDKKKTPYKLEDHGATILVPAKVVDTTRLAVMSEDLPLKGAVGFELFNKSDMGLTEFAQKINYRRALQGELARTITSIDAVESARVHLSLAEPTIFREERQPSKASVTIITRTGMTLSADTVGGIQRLVAAAVPDLNLGDVVVLDHRGVVVSAAPTVMASTADEQSPELQATAQDYETRVRNALTGLGAGRPYDVHVLAIPLIAASPETPPASDGAAAPEAEDEAVGRTFRLEVSVAVPPGLTMIEQDQVRRVAAQAIDLDETKGDMVSVAISTALAGPVVARPVAVAAPAPPLKAAAAPESLSGLVDRLMAPRTFLLTLLAPTLIALLIAAALIRRARGRARRLTIAQRRDYALRLRAFLDQEAADVRQNS